MLVLVVVTLCLVGSFRTIPTHQAMNIQAFGRYASTHRREGLLWKFPFLVSTHHLSLALQTIETPTLKINDAADFPIEIGAVAFSRIQDAARAQFSIEHPKTFVTKRLEATLRTIAAEVPYETSDEALCLRSGSSIVVERIRDRLDRNFTQGDLVDLVVEGIQIAHLAYTSRSPLRCGAASRTRPSSRSAARSLPAPSPSSSTPSTPSKPVPKPR